MPIKFYRSGLDGFFIDLELCHLMVTIASYAKYPNNKIVEITHYKTVEKTFHDLIARFEVYGYGKNSLQEVIDRLNTHVDSSLKKYIPEALTCRFEFDSNGLPCVRMRPINV